MKSKTQLWWFTQVRVAAGYHEPLGVEMIGNQYFYDIPVYRLCEKKYTSQQNSYIEKTLFPPSSPLREEMIERNQKFPRENDSLRDHLFYSFGGAWKYNEIISYIRLYFLGSQVRGEYFAVSKKRIVKTRKKQLEFQTWKLASEIEIPSKATNSEIYETVLKYLENCKNEIKNRYVDTALFEKIGPYVDWRSLLKNA